MTVSEVFSGSVRVTPSGSVVVSIVTTYWPGPGIGTTHWPCLLVVSSPLNPAALVTWKLTPGIG
ncbi:MAG: hypothetical protein V9E98_12510 [Candidatus Nanopelagicales bacterium]